MGIPRRGGHMKLADKLAKTAGKMSPRKLILLCAFFALMIFIILYKHTVFLRRQERRKDTGGNGRRRHRSGDGYLAADGHHG